MTYDFEGKVALVTGAGSGIGRATAVAFAAAGARVMISDINQDGAIETLDAICRAGGKAAVQTCDVGKSDDVTFLIRQTVAQFGRLDFAHNNAGINSMGLDEWEDDVWARSIAVNLSSFMYCMRAEAEVMLASGKGAIVNTSSINGITGNPRLPGYTAAKHGIIGLTKSGALRWASQGVRVNAICPGVIRTPMTDNVTDPDRRKFMESMTPAGEMGRPEDIAAAVLWLCSDESRFVVGHALVVDGGVTIV